MGHDDRTGTRGAAVPGFDAIAHALAFPPPVLFDDPMDQAASVALVLAPDDADLRLLFIQRAEHEGDHWSGHIAFPGGRVDAGDPGVRDAAEREVREEVGLDLATAHPLGRLDDLPGREAQLVVSGFVYGMPEPRPTRLNHEVASAAWVPLRDVEDPTRHLTRNFEYRSHTLMLPALRVLDPPAPPLWGLSYRFLELLMARLSRPIPEMPWDSSL